VSDPELLELPDEFEGRPYKVKRDAQDQAEAMLPANLVAQLGQAVAEAALVAATAHVLSCTKAGTGEQAGPMPTDWTGSPYGAQVQTMLSKLPRTSGRARAFPFHSSEC
jgi:hypothetical protein